MEDLAGVWDLLPEPLRRSGPGDGGQGAAPMTEKARVPGLIPSFRSLAIGRRRPGVLHGLDAVEVASGGQIQHRPSVRASRRSCEFGSPAEALGADHLTRAALERQRGAGRSVRASTSTGNALGFASRRARSVGALLGATLAADLWVAFWQGRAVAGFIYRLCLRKSASPTSALNLVTEGAHESGGLPDPGPLHRSWIHTP